MPIPDDPQFPTQPGYVQAVSFHILRNGDPVDLENATYYVDNISDLDAHLALRSDPSTSTNEVLGSDDSDGDLILGVSQAEVVIRSKLQDGKFEQLDQYIVRSTGQQVVTRGASRQQEFTWLSFVFTDEIDPSSEIPCADDISDNKHASLILPSDGALGEERLGAQIILDSDNDSSLFSTTEDLFLTGTLRSITTNNSRDGCTLSTTTTSEWPIIGVQFNSSDYPKAEITDPPADVKLLWVAGYSSLEN